MSLFRTLRFVVSHPLGRERRIAALLRFAGWQIRSRMARGPLAVPFVGDSRLLVRRGMTGATGNIYVGLHEYESMAFVLHFLRPQDLFVDAGANVGVYTVLASATVGARTIAFEPIESTFAALLDNVRLNRIEQRVEAHCAALGRVAGELQMTADRGAANQVVASAAAYAGRSRRVAVRRLDDVLTAAAPALMKIDVEGFEREVLGGATRLLGDARLQALIVEPFGDDGAQGSVGELVAPFGFRPYSYLPTTRQLVEGRIDDPREYCTGGNLLLLRGASEVQSRLRSAPRFAVLGTEL